MELPGPGCGVRDHDNACLCDVIVTNPVPVMERWATDSYMIAPLLERMGSDTLHHPTSLFELLVKQVDIHDSAVTYEEELTVNDKARLFDDSYLSGGARRAIKEMNDAGIKNSVITEYIEFRYGVALSPKETSDIVQSHKRTKRKRLSK